MQLWQRWFRHPDAQLWSAESEAKCVARAMETGLKFNLLTLGSSCTPCSRSSLLHILGQRTC